MDATVVCGVCVTTGLDVTTSLGRVRARLDGWVPDVVIHVLQGPGDLDVMRYDSVLQ